METLHKVILAKQPRQHRELQLCLQEVVTALPQPVHDEHHARLLRLELRACVGLPRVQPATSLADRLGPGYGEGEGEGEGRTRPAAAGPR
jgi:hypothetical protein